MRPDGSPAPTRAQRRRYFRHVKKLGKHAGQRANYRSRARFVVNHSGRRAGKTEIAKRRLVARAVAPTPWPDARFCYAAPVYRQARAIAWEDLKRMVPPVFRGGKPIESTLTIPLWHGGELFVMGMDSPDRIEGSPLDGIVMDEYGNMKPTVWTENVRPALSTKSRPGWADFIGVPEGRNHYFKMAMAAKAHALGGGSEWAYFHWPSWEVIDPEEVESARRDLDEQTFAQEYGGEFVLFSGRAYHAYGRHNLGQCHGLYRPDAPLNIALDFNVRPGVAAIIQELDLPFDASVGRAKIIGEDDEVGTCIVGEVHIPDNSDTRKVCRKILTEWGDHKGDIYVYGDASGGARGTAQTEGSDWDIVRDVLVYGIDGVEGFGHRVEVLHKPSNPSERSRINAVNARCRSARGDVRLVVDPLRCPRIVEDFEGVVTLEGGSGEIDKKRYPLLSHLTDAIGYYIDYEFPIDSQAWEYVETVF